MALPSLDQMDLLSWDFDTGGLRVLSVWLWIIKTDYGRLILRLCLCPHGKRYGFLDYRLVSFTCLLWVFANPTCVQQCWLEIQEHRAKPWPKSSKNPLIDWVCFDGHIATYFHYLCLDSGGHDGNIHSLDSSQVSKSRWWKPELAQSDARGTRNAI